ncbi:MAG: AAA family ATPase, partial [Solirubrobacteraceae bacterium]
RDAAASLLDAAGADGGRALVTGLPAPSAGDPAPAPVAGAQRLLTHVRGEGSTLALAHALLGETWVLDDLSALPDEFDGVAVTRGGRVWSPRTRELRQAPAVGEDRILAERNRRVQLVAASERAAQAEVRARDAVQRATADASGAEATRERCTSEHRAAVRALDEGTEERRRIAALIERRRTAPDEGRNAGRRSQLTAELAAEEGMLTRAQRERQERTGRLQRLRGAVAGDQELVPAVAGMIEALQAAHDAVAARLAGFDDALAADRQAGEDAAGELRACAAQEATLHTRMGGENDALTQAEVALQRARDQDSDTRAELERLAARLELEAQPALDELAADERTTLEARLERVARRREQLGPVNPLAQEEYAEAVAHVEELEAQRADLETALRELQRLITDTDKQIRTTFEQTFAATANAFEELAAQLFPGGRGRLRLVAERDGPARVLGAQEVGAPGSGSANGDAGDYGSDSDFDSDSEDEQATPAEDLLGVEIEITPAGKDLKRLSLLSGGEKSMTALAFLFAVFLARPCPFYILDEVEAALDDLNIDRFLTLLRQYASRAQFIVVTHQKRTMEAADSLYGVSMGSDGISKVISRRLPASVEAAAA